MEAGATESQRLAALAAPLLAGAQTPVRRSVSTQEGLVGSELGPAARRGTVFKGRCSRDGVEGTGVVPEVLGGLGHHIGV